MNKKLPESFTNLTLTLTSRCNLGCSYCYRPREGQDDMSPGVARAAVDLLAESRRDRLSLSFFGGEPFLALDAMDAALERASCVLHGPHVTCTTNGTAMEGRASDLVSGHGIELAMSIDGLGGPDERSMGSPGEVTRYVRQVQSLSRDDLMARMTVTPSNVGHLVASIRSLRDLGFQRIVYQPAVELDWDAASVEVWADEHRRLGTWQLGLRSAGRRVPDLPSWRRVESTLRGARLKACGAGTRLAAVRTDGSLVPCYRLVFTDLESIGDVESGFARTPVLERYEALTAGSRRSEDGDCSTCDAARGCTYYCPAMGQIMLGDPRAVPAAACRLMRAQVGEVVRFAAKRARPSTGRMVMRWAATAVAAAATTCITTGCGESTSRDAQDESDVADVAETAGDTPGEALEDIYPGVCPAEMPEDAVSDTETDPLTETVTDTGTDPLPETSTDYYPGICPAEMPYDGVSDTGSDIERDREEVGPGVCPWPGIC
ncbi:MAG: radical SAM protein [Deltaproteobacteria bacterium]|nr:radical SAM protein [Deltaproteobacteria bacterium]